MIKRSIVILIAVLAVTLPSNGEVVYRRVPLPPPSPFSIFIGAGQNLDFDNNGTSDIVFTLGFSLCTMDIPTSGCMTPYFVGATGTNGLLLSDYYSSALSLGDVIGDVAPNGAAWSSPGYNAYLTTSWWSLHGREINGQLVHSGWTGPLSTKGEGFLGVRFYMADGLHYGWIRVRLDVPGWVVDYAYETQPNTPILAGAGIDSDNDGVWDLSDECSDTPAGEVVNASGCSISQLAPCDGPWRNHGEYVAHVVATVAQFQRQRLITKADAREIVRESAQSDCGKQRASREHQGRNERRFENNRDEHGRTSPSR